jgi:hypothetical protein
LKIWTYAGKIYAREVVALELRLPKEINKFFWSLFPIIFVIKSYYNIFYNWELQFNRFNELEDFGKLFLVFGISACESALIIVLIWWIINFLRELQVSRKRRLK